MAPLLLHFDFDISYLLLRIMPDVKYEYVARKLLALLRNSFLGLHIRQ
jgi:hypothetical protein